MKIPRKQNCLTVEVQSENRRSNRPGLIPGLYNALVVIAGHLTSQAAAHGSAGFVTQTGCRLSDNQLWFNVNTLGIGGF